MSGESRIKKTRQLDVVVFELAARWRYGCGDVV